MTVEKRTFFSQEFQCKWRNRTEDEGFFNCSSLAGNYQFLYERTLRAEQGTLPSTKLSVSPPFFRFLFCFARVINVTFIVVRWWWRGIKKGREITGRDKKGNLEKRKTGLMRESRGLPVHPVIFSTENYIMKPGGEE